jgi:hypothetical protein
MKLRGDWNLDREPTRRERWLAIAIGVICALITGAVSLLAIRDLFGGGDSIPTFALYSFLFLLSIWGLLKAFWGRAARPSARAIMAVGLVLICMGMLVLLVPAAGGTQFYVAFAGVAGGASIFRQRLRKLSGP